MNKLAGNSKTSPHKNQLIMIIRIEISNETLQAINDGKNLAGSIKLNELGQGKKSAPYVFTQFNRTGRKKDKLIKVLEHGWLKESPKRVKFFSSVKKALGTTKVVSVLERETNAAINALIDRELDFVPFP